MDYEAVIVGGGAAGLSAALVLGRARRRLLVIDDDDPSNAVAPAIGGLLGQPGTAPLELLAAGRAQLAELPSVELRQASATAVDPGPDHVEVDGVRAAALLLATGMRYRVPQLPGIDELWGDTVFHCPFCHGWELRDRPLAVLGGGSHAPARAKLLRGWSDDVVLLADGAELEPGSAEDLAAAGVQVEPRQVRGLRAVDGRLAAIELAGGPELPRDGLLVSAPTEPRSSLLDDLGLECTDHGTVAVDDWGRTSVARVWAAGDVAEPSPSIAFAIASGSRAAMAITNDLLVAG